ncbi:MAG: ABC transporter ATP-binding protein [Candidatus Dadabacteria bacterium]|nr:MAG: ABC transporter ATP-binding protein [Candidatus Dadabacteria bacterium]
MKIEVNNLTKTFSDAGRALTVIDNLSIVFESGKSIAVVGTSGVGKSTLLHLLGGLERPTAGTVFVGNTNLSKLDHDELAAFRAKHVGFVFQFHYLLPEFTALENVMMPLLISGEDEWPAAEKARRVLERVGLSERTSHKPGKLSGGEQQRVAIARAIVGEPELLLADEPTGNLDAKTAVDIQILLLELNHELNNTMIIVTHNQQLASSMDHMYEMLPGGFLKLKR